MFNFPCIILAGGKSSRMGKDKALLPFGEEKTLLEYQIKRLKPLFKDLYVSLKDEKLKLDIPIIFDKEERVYSPMVAFLQILSHFPNQYIFIISVDTPFVNEEVIRKLALQKDEYEAVIPKTKETIHPLCGLYHGALFVEVEKLIKEDKHAIRNLLNKVQTNYLFFEEEKSFMNLNYKDEYESAKAILNR